MAADPQPATVCGCCQCRCESLTTYALEGSLVGVCRECFCLLSLRGILAQLQGHPSREVVGDGLATLYEYAREQLRLVEAEQDASQGGRG